VGERHILLVEPDPAFASLLTIILQEEGGHKVTTVPSPAEAAQLLSESRFDLVITEAFDQRDPFDFDPAFLSPLRAAGGDVPIILFSTYVQDSALRSGHFGLADAVPKPFDIDDLLRKVNRSLRPAPNIS